MGNPLGERERHRRAAQLKSKCSYSIHRWERHRACQWAFSSRCKARENATDDPPNHTDPTVVSTSIKHPSVWTDGLHIDEMSGMHSLYGSGQVAYIIRTHSA